MAWTTSPSLAYWHGRTYAKCSSCIIACRNDSSTSSPLRVRANNQWLFRVEVMMKYFDCCKKSIEVTMYQDSLSRRSRTLNLRFRLLRHGVIMLAAVFEVDVFLTHMDLKCRGEIDQFLKWFELSWNIFKRLRKKLVLLTRKVG